MAFLSQVVSLGLIPVFVLLTLQLLFPDILHETKDIVLLYFSRTPLHNVAFLNPLPRSETPLIISAMTHWSHFEKIANIAVILAEVGYPITLITGRIFEKEASALHPRITYYPLLGEADKLTEEQYATLASLPLGSEEAELYINKMVLVDGMPATHETLQQVYRDFRNRYGDSRPLLSFYDLPVSGHLPILLGAPGIKPDTSFAISCHPLTLDTNDTYPTHIDKVPETGPDAKSIHWKAYQDRHKHYRTRELNLAWWAKLRDMGAAEDIRLHILHAMAALPDHLMNLGIPEFEWSRSDLRENVHYFGALKRPKVEPRRAEDLPVWWGDVARAKEEGKKIVVVSQGTVETNLNDLLLPTLEALKDRDDILVIASTVVVEPEDVPGLTLPNNARATKFVPYDLLLPLTDVLVNNGGYGAVMTALSLGIPMVLAGAGQDKVKTNNLVQWSGVGINLHGRAPSVEEIREGVRKVLDDGTYKQNVAKLSKKFENYDLGEVFDRVIQGVVKEWAAKKRELK